MRIHLPEINEDNPLAINPVFIEKYGKFLLPVGPGVLARRTEYMSAPFADPFHARMDVIPVSEWDRLYDEQEGTFLHDVIGSQLAPHDQGRTNYCWAHGCVRTLECLRVWQGLSPLLLSAESVAVPITGGVNRGGTTDEAIPQLVEYGACRQELWPLNERSTRNVDPSWKVDRLRFRLLRWIETNTWEEQMTLAFRRIPVAIGLRWWGHMVCQLGPTRLASGKLGIVIDNSWGNGWGVNGRGTLDERHGTADLGSFAPIVETWATP